MKKFLLLSVLCVGLSANASLVSVDTGVFVEDPFITQSNMWEKVGKQDRKVVDVGTKILNANKLDKRAPVTMEHTPKVLNASSYTFSKSVRISQGMLSYVDCDDELAYIISHEIAHSIESYKGPLHWFATGFNSKKYEFKADLIGIDLMTKAGYNPVAAITMSNKVFGEPHYDWGFLSTHPKGSRRMMEQYKYIYKKYPWALNSAMVQNVNYQNFTYVKAKDIAAFKQREKERKMKQGTDL